jgi:hypothetical protein
MLCLILFSTQSCHDKDICDNLGKADLFLNSMRTLFSEQTQFGEVYNIVCDVTNQLHDGVCCESVAQAPNNIFKGELYYTSDNVIPMDWGDPIDTDTLTQPALSGCQKSQRGIDAEFLNDGIYLVKSIIDATNIVDEHQEDNNSISLNGRSAYTNYSKNNEGSLIIRVSGVGKSKIKDKNGKIIHGRILAIH